MKHTIDEKFIFIESWTRFIYVVHLLWLHISSELHNFNATLSTHAPHMRNDTIYMFFSKSGFGSLLSLPLSWDGRVRTYHVKSTMSIHGWLKRFVGFSARYNPRKHLAIPTGGDVLFYYALFMHIIIFIVSHDGWYRSRTWHFI